MPKAVLVILLLFVSSYHLQAQTWEVGGSVGAAGYIGDLNPNNPIKPSGISAGIFVKRNFDGYFSARLTYSYGRIAAADSTSSSQQQRDRNLSFTDGLKELSLIGEFNFMNYIPDAGPNRYTPFIYAGFGITGYNPRTTFEGSQVNLRPLKTEGGKPYGDNTVVIPYGVGIKYNFQGKWNLAADLGYRYVLTDYLDDVSGSYIKKSALTSDLSRALSDRSGEVTGNYIGSPGSQRGDFKPRDTYFFLGISISYTFVTQRCYY
ncbi:Outer membrane protein beta-barrel domain-containing protein [Mucilaginibacter pineti]|uniref:Outer membrane protein beta-barrel domain-containing protein n=1 Tax=Mucilaginibacter pineti TaxID=1391627 RepID=A0A1G6WJS5_9SPHI|nr:DUF6089 family protein [Mucilaginibacter pineti]SDD65497.1 Outer membrane protein beta-barrel domain-containing protein [Mucilaginibacter pineti]